MKNYRIEIKKDLFNISKRIKKIDRNYKVFFNKMSLKFEVWNKRELSFVVENSLDYQTLLKTHKTNVRNVKALICDMEKQTKNLKRKKKKFLKTKIRPFFPVYYPSQIKSLATLILKI